MVYRPADHSLSALFLDELSSKIDSCILRLLIGGDLNLLRSPSDKNNGNFSWPLADLFNDFISECALHEIPRVGGRITRLTLFAWSWTVFSSMLLGTHRFLVLPLSLNLMLGLIILF